MSTDLLVVAILTAKSDKADALRAILLQATEAFRRQDGCLSYTLHEDLKHRGRFVTYETWRDEKALAAHMTSATMDTAKPKLASILEGEMQQLGNSAPSLDSWHAIQAIVRFCREYHMRNVIFARKLELADDTI